MPMPSGVFPSAGVELGELSGLSGAQLQELRSLNRKINQAISRGKAEDRRSRYEKYRK